LAAERSLGDPVNYFRDLRITQVKFGLVAERVNQVAERSSTFDRGEDSIPGGSLINRWGANVCS